MHLKNNVAIVTGGASGIGKATAKKLAEHGAEVVIFDIQEEEGKQVAEEIGGKFHYCDVKNANLVEEEINEVGKEFGRIDTLFINAGINGMQAPIEDLEVDDWHYTLQTNLESTFTTLKYAIPHMKKNGGSVIITSSINGNREFSNMGASAYATSKAGQMAFGKMASVELAQYGIRVNIVCPGAFDTNISERTYKDKEALEKIKITKKVEPKEMKHPLKGESGEPERVADLVTFLASDNANHITGTEIYIDQGETLI